MFNYVVDSVTCMHCNISSHASVRSWIHHINISLDIVLHPCCHMFMSTAERHHFVDYGILFIKSWEFVLWHLLQINMSWEIVNTKHVLITMWSQQYFIMDDTFGKKTNFQYGPQKIEVKVLVVYKILEII